MQCGHTRQTRDGVDSRRVYYATPDSFLALDGEGQREPIMTSQCLNHYLTSSLSKVLHHPTSVQEREGLVGTEECDILRDRERLHLHSFYCSV